MGRGSKPEVRAESLLEGLLEYEARAASQVEAARAEADSRMAEAQREIDAWRSQQHLRLDEQKRAVETQVADESRQRLDRLRARAREVEESLERFDSHSVVPRLIHAVLRGES